MSQWPSHLSVQSGSSGRTGEEGENPDQLFTIYDFLESLHQLGIQGVTIPDTCVLINGRCEGLYWYDRAGQNVNYDANWPHGEVQQEKLFSTKKAAESTVREEMIVKHFSQDKEPGHVCAIFVSPRPGPSGSMCTSTRYFCPEGLDRLIHRELDEETSGILIKFTTPRSGYHNLIRVIYAPYVTKVEKHECRVALDDIVVPLQKRTSTMARAGTKKKGGGDGSSGNRWEDAAPVLVEPSLGLRKQVDKYCKSIAEARLKQSGVEIQQMILYLLDPTSSTIQEDALLSGGGGRRHHLPSDESTINNSDTSLSGGGRRTGGSLQLAWCSLLEVRNSFEAPTIPKPQIVNANEGGGSSPGGGRKSTLLPQGGNQVTMTAKSNRRSLFGGDAKKQAVGGGFVLTTSGPGGGDDELDPAVKFPCPEAPPASPLQEGIEQTDATIAMYDGIQHFGFYDDEPRKVKNSLKKQVQTVSYVTSPASGMVFKDEPPYSMEFISALIDPVKGERYWNKINNRTPLSKRKSTLRSSMSPMGFRNRARRESVINNSSLALDASTRSLGVQQSFGNFSASYTPKRSPTAAQGGENRNAAQTASLSQLDPSALAQEQTTRGGGLDDRLSPGTPIVQYSPQRENSMSMTYSRGDDSVERLEVSQVPNEPAGISFVADPKKHRGGNAKKRDPVIEGTDQRHEGRILHLRYKYDKAGTLAEEEDTNYFQGRVRKQQIRNLASKKVQKLQRSESEPQVHAYGATTRTSSNDTGRVGGVSPTASSANNSSPVRHQSSATILTVGGGATPHSHSGAGGRSKAQHPLGPAAAATPTAGQNRPRSGSVYSVSLRSAGGISDRPASSSHSTSIRPTSKQHQHQQNQRAKTSMSQQPLAFRGDDFNPHSHSTNQSNSVIGGNNGKKKGSSSMNDSRPLWVDVTQKNYSSDPPIHRPALANDSLRQIRKAVPQYESMLHDTSLMNYLVGAEEFDKPPERKAFKVSKKELAHLGETRRLETMEQVPDAPVVQAGNLHCSLSEEIMAKRRKEGVKSRDLLKLLFDDSREENQKRHRRERERRADIDRQLEEEHEERRRSDEERRKSGALQHSEMVAEEQRQRNQMQSTYAAHQTRQKVQNVLQVFEDLMYAQRSQRLVRRVDEASMAGTFINRRSNSNTSTTKGGGAAGNSFSSGNHQQQLYGSSKEKSLAEHIVIAIPPQHHALTSELHSLMIGVGFHSRPISDSTLDAVIEEANTLRSTLNDGYDDEDLYDDDMEQMPINEYYLPSDPATMRRSLASAQNYGEEVKKLYSSDHWEEIGKIKKMMEGEGYTMYDAVSAIVKRKKNNNNSSISVVERRSTEQTETLDYLPPVAQTGNDSGQQVSAASRGGRPHAVTIVDE